MDASPGGAADSGIARFGPTLSTQTSELLGFPADTRLLIINCDDPRNASAGQPAVLQAIHSGVASSCSLMVPGPAAEQEMRLLQTAPDVPFGIHLTLTRDGPAHPWAPVCPPHEVPSLVETGCSSRAWQGRTSWPVPAWTTL